MKGGEVYVMKVSSSHAMFFLPIPFIAVRVEKKLDVAALRDCFKRFHPVMGTHVGYESHSNEMTSLHLGRSVDQHAPVRGVAVHVNHGTIFGTVSPYHLYNQALSFVCNQNYFAKSAGQNGPRKYLLYVPPFSSLLAEGSKSENCFLKT
jgi:hypothetical protein